MIKDFIPATQIVRAVLRKHGVNSYNIYTNNYKKCKTVKTYLSRIAFPQIVCDQISSSLKDAGYENFTFKFNTRKVFGGMFSSTAFIVRLPKE